MRIAVDTAPATEPVTLAEAKAWVNVTHDVDNDLLTSLITAAREHVEERIGRALVTQTLTVTLDVREAAPPIVLPRGPVQSVSSLKYWDDVADAFATAATSAYYLAGDRLCIAEGTAGTAWPTADRTFAAYTVTYVAGYGNAAAVPGPVKRALLIVLADLYEHRDTPLDSGLVVGQLPVTAEKLLHRYENYALG